MKKMKILSMMKKMKKRMMNPKKVKNEVLVMFDSP